MNKIRLLTKKDLYEDIQRLDENILKQQENILEQQEEIKNLSEEIACVKKRAENYSDELENIYYLLKQIEEITKNDTIRTLCILKRNEIKNMTGIYIRGD